MTEINPEMSDAGATIVRDYGHLLDPASLAEKVYAAMNAASNDAADAKRWRAFAASERFTCMGWSGFLTDPKNPMKFDANAVHLHLTLNIWNDHPSTSDDQAKQGRAILMTYVDELVKRRREQKKGTTDGNVSA